MIGEDSSTDEASVLLLMLRVLASLSSAECEDAADDSEETLRNSIGFVPAISGASYDSGLELETRATGEEICERCTGLPAR